MNAPPACLVGKHVKGINDMKSLSLIIGIVFMVVIVYIVGMGYHNDLKGVNKLAVKLKWPFSFLFFSTRQDQYRDVRGIVFQCSALISALILIPELSGYQFLGFETTRNISVFQLILLFGVQFLLSLVQKEK